MSKSMGSMMPVPVVHHYFLSPSFADFEIVIEKTSWIDRQDFPVFAHILNRKSGSSIFLPTRYLTRVPYAAFCSDSAYPQLTGPTKASKPPNNKMNAE